MGALRREDASGSKSKGTTPLTKEGSGQLMPPPPSTLVSKSKGKGKNPEIELGDDLDFFTSTPTSSVVKVQRKAGDYSAFKGRGRYAKELET